VRGQVRTPGILGGMGPEATIDFWRSVLRVTGAGADQDHLEVVVVCDPGIPDRTAAICSGGKDPTESLLRAARRCVVAGADFLVVPCNTAHYFLPAVQAALDVPVVNMIKEVARRLLRLEPTPETVGVMATSGTLKAGLYQAVGTEAGWCSVLPTAVEQEGVMRAIYAIKAGQIEAARPVLARVALHLAERGAQAVVAGCTEIPLGLQPGDIPAVQLVDATSVLAEATLGYALGEAVPGFCDPLLMKG